MTPPGADLIPPVRMQPPEEAAVLPNRLLGLGGRAGVAQLGDARRDAAARRPIRAEALEADRVLGVVGDCHNRVTLQLQEQLQRVSAAAQDARFQHVLLAMRDRPSTKRGVRDHVARQ